MRRSSLVLLIFCSLGCSDGSDDKFPAAQAERALVDYKQLVNLNYQEALNAARQLDMALAAFASAPSQATLDTAKQAWIAARVPYGPSEAFRFYDGPIDNPETGPEGSINAWPLDENYIDYTRDDANAGMINDPMRVPNIDAAVIADANEKAGEKAISTGYHAIEFLLWGQDDLVPAMGPNHAGKRPFTDYVAPEQGGTTQNQMRRRTYLSAASSLLISDLESVLAAWTPGRTDNFAASFGVVASDPNSERDARKEAIGKILRSLGSMAKAELAGERMTVAYQNRDQEDEHSCFSDNTAADLLGNGVGIENVWLGRYGAFDGVGIDEVVAAVDPALATQTTADFATAVAKLRVLADLQNQGTPIDFILSQDDASTGRIAMREAIEALRKVAVDVEQAAAALGLTIALEEPSVEL